MVGSSKNDFRVAGNGAGQTDPFLHAAGEFRGHQIAYFRRHADLRQFLNGYILGFSASAAVFGKQSKGDVFPNR